MRLQNNSVLVSDILAVGKQILIVVIILATVAVELHASGKSRNYLDSNSVLNEGECYKGIIPKFHKDPRTGRVWYFKFTLLALKSDASCYPAKKIDIRYHFVELLSGKEISGKTGGTSAEKGHALRKVFSEPIVFSPGQKKPASDKFRYLTNRLSINWFSEVIHYPELTIESGRDGLDGILEKSASFSITSEPTNSYPESEKNTEKPSRKKSEQEKKYILNYGVNGNHINTKAQMDYIFSEDIFYSSNGCWIILPNTKIRLLANPKNTSIFTKKHTIYSLSGKRPNEPDEVICSPAGFWPTDGTNFDESRIARVALPKSAKFEHLDFHLLNKNHGDMDEYFPGIFDDPDKPYDNLREVKPALVEDTSAYGIDYTAYSPSFDQLDIVYQVGFLSNHNKKDYPDKDEKYYLSKEKVLTGDLEYISYKTNIRTTPPDAPYVDVRMDQGEEVRFNITENCDHLFTGWESAPKLSADKSNLYFLAQDDAGDDSSRTNLYFADFKKIRDRKFDCTNPDHIKNLARKLKLKPGDADLQYPIHGYSVSPDQQKITILFEIEGQTVVRFFRFNNNSKRIVHMYPQSISGLGKIYDFVLQDYATSYTGGSIVYVMHSRLNMPARISRCYQKFSQFVCGDPDSPIDTTSFGKTLISTKNDPDEISVSVETIEFSDCPSGVTVPGFLLRPSIPNGKAIVSVHGGPNESWDGRFSQTDFVLARTGYTVFMPNPSGSTGYGWAHTKAGHHEWGTTIYQDIECTINHVKKRFEKLYLMGFSFGGYIANWIQTNPNDQLGNKVEAMIALSPLFGLQEFARTTDQFWFPQFQLGCSGKSCPTEDDTNQCAYPETLPVIEQNPARYTNCDTNKLNNTPVPMLIISPQSDTRIPLCKNTSEMLKIYREKRVPFTYKEEPKLGHGFLPHIRMAHGKFVHDWIESLSRNSEKSKDNKGCKNGDAWNPDCVDKKTNTKIFDTSNSEGPHCTVDSHLIKQAVTPITPAFLLNLYP